jgi:hypothetical protein
MEWANHHTSNEPIEMWHVACPCEREKIHDGILFFDLVNSHFIH